MNFSKNNSHKFLPFVEQWRGMCRTSAYFIALTKPRSLVASCLRLTATYVKVKLYILVSWRPFVYLLCKHVVCALKIDFLFCHSLKAAASSSASSTFCSDKIICRFHEVDGRIFTLSAYLTPNGAKFVRIQRTYYYDGHRTELGEGIDIPKSEWNLLVKIWPEVKFCWRFNMNRTFNVVDVPLSSSLHVVVKKLGDCDDAVTSHGSPSITLSKQQVMDDGYIREGEVTISAYTALKFDSLFESISESMKDSSD